MRLRPRTLITIAFCAAGVGLVALAVSNPDDASRATAGPTTSLASSSTTSIVVAQPEHAGESETELGARRAAVRFLELTEVVVTATPDAAAEVQRSISTTRSAGRLAGEVSHKLEVIQAQAPDGVRVQIAPVAARSHMRGAGWDVSIWYVQVTQYGSEVAVEHWATATYSLVWESGQWRMDDLTSSAGPIPARPANAAASPVGAYARALDGFTDEGIAP
jgi:hypothetical protein